jgi:uncharacterized protein
MLNEWWLAYLVVGGFVGFFAGLLGIGGGVIMVPMLTTLFLLQGIDHGLVMHLALGSSMATIVLTSVSSFRAHHAHGAVLWRVVWRITPGVLLGTFLATFIAARISTTALALIFTLFMFYVSAQMLANIKPKPSRQLPGVWGMTGVGAGIGGFSALVAVGGGSLLVPFMTWCNVRVHDAIGTSSAIGFPIALSGTLGYIVHGLATQGLPPYTLGYVNLPAFLLLASTSVLTAPIGARVAHRLPVATLKRIFAGLLLLLCIKMLFGLFA